MFVAIPPLLPICASAGPCGLSQYSRFSRPCRSSCQLPLNGNQAGPPAPRVADSTIAIPILASAYPVHAETALVADPFLVAVLATGAVASARPRSDLAMSQRHACPGGWHDSTNEPKPGAA
jgi:hypothetical protein